MGFLSRLKKRLAVAPSQEGQAPVAAAQDWKETLSTHFSLTQILGVGGYSTVYRGTRRADQRTYAVKVTDLAALTEWSRHAAVREARVLAAMTGAGGGYRHPCIATYREAFCLGSRLCIVTDPAPGGDLKRLLQQRAAAGERLAEREVWAAFLQAALALQHLHAHRVLHRDMKPHNVLMGAGGLVQLTDFGVCGQLSRVFTRKQAGTPQYKAPEMWRGEAYSFSSDMWALGCLLYEMCAGQPLFDAPPGCTGEAAVEAVRQQVLAFTAPPALPAGFSADLASLLAQLLRPLPADRPSADEFLALPEVAAHMHEVPAAVRACLVGAAAAQQRWQQQQQGAAQDSAPELADFTPQHINACLPPAAYPSGDAGLLGKPQLGAWHSSLCTAAEQSPTAARKSRGRGPARDRSAGSSRERSSSAASVRSAVSTSSPGSCSGDSLSCLDLAVPLACFDSSGCSKTLRSQGASFQVLAPGQEGRARLASADGSRVWAFLARQSCPSAVFLATPDSSSTVHI